jgi:hypothetical protein
MNEINLAQIENSSLFSRWRDPVTGVESYILSQRVAPVQQSFYFTHSGFSADGRYLWFYCAFPPGGDAYYGRQLGVIDFEEDMVRHFPETQFMDASPFVDPDTGGVYWVTGLEIWKRGPLPGDQPERVGTFPAELAKGRRPLRIATHLSRSADGKSFAIDALIGTDCFVGDMPLDGGPFRLWEKRDYCLNHAQFSPTDPDLILLAADGWVHPSTGERGRRPLVGNQEDRMWIIRRGGESRPACPRDPVSSDLRGHEWWDADGVHIWYIEYHGGTAKVNILTGEQTMVWPNGHSHSHCDRSGQYLVGDINPQHIRMDLWRIAFFNTLTGKEINIVSELPPLPPRGPYHIHPHPRFCLDDQYICHTTNVLGTIDVALTPVSQLVERTQDGKR